MELESKFIEGTNNQYSIRNDGVVISHKRNRILKKQKNYVCVGSSANKLSISTLLKKYFGFRYCSKCNEKMTNLNKLKCEKCSPYGHYHYISHIDKEYQSLKSKAWRESNKEHYQNITLLHSEKNKESLSRSYIAHTLHIPVKDMTEELYELAKAKILLIRLIKSKKKCQTQQL